MFDKLIIQNSVIIPSEIIIDKSKILNNAKENSSLDPATICAPLKSKDAAISFQSVPDSHGLYEFAYEICVHSAETVFSPYQEPPTFNGFLFTDSLVQESDGAQSKVKHRLL